MRPRSRLARPARHLHRRRIPCRSRSLNHDSQSADSHSHAGPTGAPRRLSGRSTEAVLDLLANRSGLPLRDGLEFDLASRQDGDDGALSRLAADVVAANRPVAGFWSYTNVGWCVLGRVI